MKKDLDIRMKYYGGKPDSRIVKDKLNSLKKAILYSYQSATIELSDGRQFKGLMNPDKLKPEYDNKIISIPYRNNCLNKEEFQEDFFPDIENINLKTGDVFKWKETNTLWIVFLQYLEEKAYFRGEVRKCDDSAEIEINGIKYKIYIRGPVETKIPWNQKAGLVWNDNNLTLDIYITKNNDTLKFFKRFQKVKIKDQYWEVQAANSFDASGIIEVALKESFNNSLEDSRLEEEKAKEEELENQNILNPKEIFITGPIKVHPYDKVSYSINTSSVGQWKINNDKIKIINQQDNKIDLEILSRKHGSFTIEYISDNHTIDKMFVEILSL